MKFPTLISFITVFMFMACTPRHQAWNTREKISSQADLVRELPTAVRKMLKDFVLIEGGGFAVAEGVRGKDTFSSILTPTRITLGSFYLQRYEVSVKDFMAFCKATGIESNKPDTLSFLRDFRYSYDERMTRLYFQDPSYHDFPIVGVTMQHVRSYIAWKQHQLDSLLEGTDYVIELRLPTNPELEYSMFKPTGNSAYENVDNIPGTIHNWSNGAMNRWNTGMEYNSNNMLVKWHSDDGYIYMAPVKSMKENARGLYHIRGNVAEWTSTQSAKFIHTRDGYSITHLPEYNPGGNKDRVIPEWEDTCFSYYTTEFSNRRIHSGDSQLVTRCFSRRVAEVLQDTAYYLCKGGSWAHGIFYLQRGAFLPLKATESHFWLGFRMAMNIRSRSRSVLY